MAVEEREVIETTRDEQARQEQKILDIYRAFSRVAPTDVRVEYHYPHTVANVTKQIGGIGLNRWVRKVVHPTISMGTGLTLDDLTNHLLEGGVSSSPQDASSLIDKMVNIQLDFDNGSYLNLYDRTPKHDGEYGSRSAPRAYELSVYFKPDPNASMPPFYIRSGMP